MHRNSINHLIIYVFLAHIHSRTPRTNCDDREPFRGRSSHRLFANVVRQLARSRMTSHSRDDDTAGCCHFCFPTSTSKSNDDDAAFLVQPLFINSNEYPTISRAVFRNRARISPHQRDAVSPTTMPAEIRIYLLSPRHNLLTTTRTSRRTCPYSQ